jgi:hypothetical protein
MEKLTYGKKRNKLLVALMSPVFFVVFMVGWVFYFIGQSERPKARQPQQTISKVPPLKEGIELIVIPNEEEKIMAE